MPRRIILLAAAALLAAVPAAATITISPSQPNADQAVTFSVTVPSGTIGPGSTIWNFGDGTTAAGQPIVQKTYAAAGTYTIDVQYSYIATFAQTPMIRRETASLVVSERRRIVCLTPSPMVGQSVSFLAENFFSSSIQWNFGDGAASVLAGPSVNHVFGAPGSFIVTAKDFGGSGLSTITLRITVNVDISRRRITYAPPLPGAGFPVTFTARNFFTNQILWDFGDGQSSAHGTAAIAHTFARSGIYMVQAWDWDGRIGGPTSVSVQVSEPSGLRSAFQISVLQLRFEDGLSYKVVPARFTPLTAYVDLKYEGTGLFQAQWLVDGMPFRSVSQALSQAQSITLDSGRLPGLPTQLTGMHEVSLRILSPAVGFTIPVIRYFVSMETGRPPLTGLDLEVEGVEGLQGVDCALTLGELRADAGRYFILHGKIQSNLPGGVKIGLLRVHLGTDLLDQQILRDLQPGRPVDFATSVRNPEPGARILYITLYDITEAASPKLLSLKKFTIRSER
jgi:PKD repeat protein